MMQVGGMRDAAPQAVPGIDRASHINFAVNHREPRIINPTDFIILYGENRLLLHLPVKAVRAEGQASPRLVPEKLARPI